MGAWFCQNILWLNFTTSPEYLLMICKGKVTPAPEHHGTKACGDNEKH
jgi:hypothetical protein